MSFSHTKIWTKRTKWTRWNVDAKAESARGYLPLSENIIFQESQDVRLRHLAMHWVNCEIWPTFAVRAARPQAICWNENDYLTHAFHGRLSFSLSLFLSFGVFWQKNAAANRFIQFSYLCAFFHESHFVMWANFLKICALISQKIRFFFTKRLMSAAHPIQYIFSMLRTS